MIIKDYKVGMITADAGDYSSTLIVTKVGSLEVELVWGSNYSEFILWYNQKGVQHDTLISEIFVGEL